MKNPGKDDKIKFEKVNMIVYGRTNKHFMYKIQDIEYVIDQKLFYDEKIYEIFRQDEE